MIQVVAVQALPFFLAALLAFQASAPAEPTPALLKTASAALEAGRNADAADAFQKILAIDKNLPAAYAGLGVALGRLGRYPESIAAFQKGIRLAPHDAALHYNLAVVYQALARYDEAV